MVKLIMIKLKQIRVIFTFTKINSTIINFIKINFHHQSKHIPTSFEKS